MIANRTPPHPRSHALVAMALLGLTALAGCTAEGTAVSVRVYAAEGALHDTVLSNGSADTLELVLSADGETFVENFALAEGRGSVTSVPIGSGYQFTARGFRGSETSVLFYGASARFDVDAGDSVEVPIQVGRSNCIGLNRSSPLRDPADGGSADLRNRRVGASMSTLPDGRILLLGGAEVGADGEPERILDTAEIFDPVHNQFIELPWRLVLPRAFHTATVLRDGEVLVAGGVVGVSPDGLVVSDTAALIEPDEVEAVRPFPAPMPVEARAWHRARRLPDGSVLIVGGEGGDGTPLGSAVRFIPPDDGDPIAGRFRVQGSLHAARTRFTMTRTGNPANPTLIVGGLGSAGPAAAVELFTTNPGQGGCAGGGNPTDDIGCFIRPGAAELQVPRWGHGAALVENGAAVLVVGGYETDDRSAPTPRIERIGLVDFRVQGVGQLDTPRGEAATAVIADGGAAPYVLVVGGRVGDTPLTATSRLVPAQDPGDASRYLYTDTAVEDGCGLSEPRFGHRALTLDTRTVLLIGGINRTPAGLAGSRRVELFFPAINVF